MDTLKPPIYILYKDSKTLRHSIMFLKLNCNLTPILLYAVELLTSSLNFIHLFNFYEFFPKLLMFSLKFSEKRLQLKFIIDSYTTVYVNNNFEF